MAKELGIFVDESGDTAGLSRYYLLTLVFHDQSKLITKNIIGYEKSLAEKNLPNIPFHSEPLLNGRNAYHGLKIEQRKKLLYSFNVLLQRLPIFYTTFIYNRSEVADPNALSIKMKKDISSLLVEHLNYFQMYDRVKVYYDNGQDIVLKAIKLSLTSELSPGVLHLRKTSMVDYRLEQAADYFCTVELAAKKYAVHENGETYNKFFGGVGSFKKNWLKQARRKLLR